MDIFHIGRCENAILSGCQIDEEGERSSQAGRGVCDAHGEDWEGEEDGRMV